MIPGVLHGIARNAGRLPFLVHVVPHVPLVSAGNTALMAVYKSIPIEILVNVELHYLGDPQLRAIEVQVVRKVVKIRNDLAVFIFDPLRREVSNQRIRPQDIGIRMTAANGKLGRISSHGWRPHTLTHGPRHATSARFADVIVRRVLSISLPAASPLQSTEYFSASGDGYLDVLEGRTTAVIPHLDHRVVVAWSNRDICVQLRTIYHVVEFAIYVDAHRCHALRATGSGGR